MKNNAPKTLTAFMDAIQPDCDWTLTAFEADGPGMETMWFGHGTDVDTGHHITDLQDWVDRMQSRGFNIYFQPNPLKRRLTKREKAKVTDVSELRYIAVDKDPEPGQPLGEQQELILADLVAEGFAWIAFTGGGYQGFKKLTHPVPVGGDQAKADDLKRHGQWLAQKLDGDHCHSLAQLMRAPFTDNIPDAKKRERNPERQRVQAVLMSWDIDKAEPITAFKKAKLDPMGDFEKLEIGAAEELTHEDLIEYKVEPAVSLIMINGVDPDNPTKHASRSEWLFEVVCHLIRKSVPYEKILYAITNYNRHGSDPEQYHGWRIGESVFYQRNGRAVPRPISYALRQISRAQALVDAELAEPAKTNGPMKFHTDSDGKIIKLDPHNWRVFLQELGVTLSYDQFNSRPLIEGLKDFGPQLTDAAVNRLRISILENPEWRINLGKDLFYDFIVDEAHRNTFHPVRDYMQGLIWDGRPRLDNWLTTYFGVPASSYAKEVGRIVLIAAVRRIMQPGCKFDEMMILEGPQGLGKSSALEILACKKEWFSDGLDLGKQAKEIIEQTAGKVIIEAAEMVRTNAKADQLKATLSRSVDRSRMSYGRLSEDYPRQFVIIATLNPEEGGYLIDPTGNRRFWPVECTAIDHNALLADRDQLWAEAVMQEAQGASIRLPKNLWPIAAEQQAKRQKVNPVEEIFEAKMGGRTGRIAIGLMYDLLGLKKGDHAQTKLMGQAAAALGWDRCQVQYDGSQKRCYARGTLAERAVELRPYRCKDGTWTLGEMSDFGEGDMIPERWDQG